MRDWIWIRPTMRTLAETIAREHGLTVEELRSPSHSPRYAWPRQEAMAAMHDAGFSNRQAANFFHRKDHTTAVYARQAVAARRALAEREAA